jgi:hypothetical protein
LQLVAGSVNVPAPPPSPGMLRSIGRVSAASADNRFQQENFGEYHLYTLQRPTTIADNQSKQVALLSAHQVPVHKTFELRGQPSYYRESQPDLGERLSVGVYISFENKGGDLGIPLPAGVVRLYERDRTGTSQFLGGDSIDHTPRNETVRLHVGDAFDVTARKKQTEFHAFDGWPEVYESSYEIVLSNAKKVPVNVIVVEPVPGDWEIRSESAPHVKSSSSSANWTIRVPADGHTRLTYTVRTHF